MYSETNKLTVSFWGTRGSISTPGINTQKYGGNTPCIHIQYGEDSVILDAGTGIRPLGLELAKQIKNGANCIRHILLSHTHWDHIQGLPFFAPAYIPGCELVIYGSPQKERFLSSILQGQMNNNYFPVKMSELAAKITIREVGDQSINIGALKITFQEHNFHPGGSQRIKIEADDKKLIYSTDVELNAMVDSMNLSENEEAPMQVYRNFIAGADLLIADGQYTKDEYDSKKGWGHTSIPLLLQTSHEQCVKQLAITHHDPDHSDAFIDNLEQQYSSIYKNTTPKMNLFWAKEGQTIAI
jgi:phosphoribosyl 1,2-cyclic phosphodiesterase